MNRRTISPFASQAEDGSMEARRKLLIEWAADPWAFITGRDIDGTPMILTKDEADTANPYKPIPLDKPHIPRLLGDLWGPEKVVLVQKSRQMFASTTACIGGLYHHCLFRSGRKCFISKTKESQAVMMLNDKIRGVHRRTPAWFQDLFPLSMTPATHAKFERTDSEILAVTESAAEGELRGNTVSVALIDEAATQDHFPDMMRAAQPMASRIWILMTPENGNPGAELAYQLVTAP